MKNNQFRFFSGKIVTSLTDIFTMEEALFKIICWRKIFICEPIFEIFVALFKTYGMQSGGMVIFFLRSFRKSEVLKNAVSGRWCLDSIGRLLEYGCSFGLQHVLLVHVCQFCFFHHFVSFLFCSGNFFLIAPFPDHCLRAISYVKLYLVSDLTKKAYVPGWHTRHGPFLDKW